MYSAKKPLSMWFHILHQLCWCAVKKLLIHSLIASQGPNYTRIVFFASFCWFWGVTPKIRQILATPLLVLCLRRIDGYANFKNKFLRILKQPSLSAWLWTCDVTWHGFLLKFFTFIHRGCLYQGRRYIEIRGGSQLPPSPPSEKIA